MSLILSKFVPRIQTVWIVVSALLICGSACSRKPQAGTQRGSAGPVPVNVGDVVTKNMPLDLRSIGNVQSIASVGVKAQVPGELISVHFTEGQDVKKGDLLFTIQPRLYQVQLAQAEANLTRDRVTAENARREAERNQQLGVKGAISKEQLDQMRAAADAAMATVKADEALVEIARVRLGYTTIESPIDGRTGALRVHAGNLIKENADDPMVTIHQLAPIYVTFTLPEQHLAEIRKAQTERNLSVTAVHPKANQPLAEGELTFIDNTVDPATGTIALKATFANDDRALWPGSFVDVLLHLRVDPSVTVVPASSVMVGQRGTQVFVVTSDNLAELRPVVVARTVGEESVIEKGLAAGEKVVVNGQSRLMPGAKVVIKPAEVKAASL
jgi:multidrug efflux system membrane fusion protein